MEDLDLRIQKGLKEHKAYLEGYLASLDALKPKTCKAQRDVESAKKDAQRKLKATNDLLVFYDEQGEAASQREDSVSHGLQGQGRES